MMPDELTKFVNIRRNGTIVLANSILCDGNDEGGMDFNKKITCYTHSHDDHLKGLDERLGVDKAEVYCSSATKKIASAIYQTSGIPILHERRNFKELDIPETVSLNVPYSKFKKVKLSLKKCHHILGSASVLVEADGTSIFYAGDFLKEGTHVEKDVNYLILDATRGKHSESQVFDDKREARMKIVELAKKLFDKAEDDGCVPRLNIHAHRGTMQLVMSWLREAVPYHTKFLASEVNCNIAKVYSEFGHECGDVEDEEGDDLRYKKIDRYAKENVSYIHFLPINEMPQNCEIFGNVVPSVRIGSSTTSSTNDPEYMYRINLKEHATIPEILEYVKETNPKNVIIDNSTRVDNPDNGSYLAQQIKKINKNVILFPEKHPNLR